ncbi:hypothetical protein MJO28_002271 [Puccinia striiformis f. sp. tritici]|uniref:Uncharacterized protein n=1 Tax=Puccinia striiformis f. sp. tritici TaxID=168172 RepID=A0ACC0EWN5_9BASI|nr:hypothetical protein MJO28_002271 [Puccinia striiformis f. sp. tritici]KAI7966611.1 hypothetical protein MJO29_002359 [Puccinia striiformis f. sp. tritici]
MESSPSSVERSKLVSTELEGGWGDWNYVETVIHYPAGSDIHEGQDSDSEDKPIEIIKVAKTRTKLTLRTNRQLVVKQVSKNTGQEVIIDVTQDSDDNNGKVAGHKPKQLLVDKDGFDQP